MTERDVLASREEQGAGSRDLGLEVVINKIVGCGKWQRS